MKKKQVNEWYSLDEIKKLKCQYNIIFGKRSNGKTYSLLEEAVKNFINNGKQAAYLRRYRDDFKGKRGEQVCAGIVASGLVSKLTEGKYNTIIYKSDRWYLSSYNKEDDTYTTMTEPFMFGFALTQMEHDKSTSYPNITIIIFDEFLSRVGYLRDEFLLLMNVISTIVRQRDDVTIYMLGNTVNKYCPYFKEMGLSHIENMEPGTIDVYTYGESKLKVAVEYCENHNVDGRKSDTYFAFDNPSLQMITGGSWEIDIYPHLPRKYEYENILFTFFIIFNNATLQCEVLSFKDCMFLYIHRKSGEIKYPDKDIIFSEQYDPRPNYYRNIKKGTTTLSKKLGKFFSMEKVFYQDNEVGEIVRNYLQWCSSN